MNKNNALSLSRRNLLVGSATLATAAWISPTFAASSSSGIRAMIHAQNTRAPISPMIYGGFIEHIGNLINHSLWRDRKSTRLNSSHVAISYAVFCLKKKKTEKEI